MQYACAMQTKVCTKCKSEKPVDQYSVSRQGKRGPVYRSSCKSCQASRAREWFAENSERANENRRRWNLENRYGITVEQYAAMLADQGGVCAICGQGEPNEHGRTGTRFRLAVDHDHETGRVRGLLCQKCNRAIGLLGDNPQRLRDAADYVEKGRGHN